MSQSLYTAMGGIAAAQTDLNVISNNIANLNTTAFKSSSVNFSDVYSTTISSGTAATETTGGTNPMQVGLGVQVSSISKDFSSGTWVATGKTTDLMIQGNGFFTVQDSSGTTYYTRAGDFSIDSDGDLVTSNGYKVLGTSSLLSTKASTTAVHIPQAIDREITANAVMGSENVANLNNCTLTEGTFYVSSTAAPVPPATVGVTTRIPVELAAADLTGTVDQLASVIQNQLGAPAASGITVDVVDGCITFAVDGTISASLAFSNPTAADIAADPTLEATNFISATDILNAKISPTGVYSSKILDYNVTVSQVTSVDSTNYTKCSSYSIGEDGSIEVTYDNGDKMSVQLSNDGNNYEFVYTTAENVEITGAKCNVNPSVATEANLVIQLASVTNPEGLISAGNNLFTAGPNTGDIVYSVGNEMGLGSVASGGLEASNVDLSAEFSGMILAQRAVQANSRVFTTTSDVMDVITQMGR